MTNRGLLSRSLAEELADAFYIGNAELFRGGRMAEQAALAEFIAEGHFTAHLKRTRTVYQERRDALHREPARHEPRLRGGPGRTDWTRLREAGGGGGEVAGGGEEGVGEEAVRGVTERAG